MAAIRSFFAVPLSSEAEQQLTVARERLRHLVEHGLNPEASIRWISPQNYHLTLAFLGDIQQRDLLKLHEVALQIVIDTPPDTFSLTHFEWFPSTLKPRLLVAIPTACDAIYRLQKQLHRGLHQQGYHVDSRVFRPHISLARVKNIARPVDIGEEPLSICCELDELVLYSSVQNRDGVVYSPLFVEPIGACP